MVMILRDFCLMFYLLNDGGSYTVFIIVFLMVNINGELCLISFNVSPYLSVK